MRRIRLPGKLPTVKFPLHYEGAPQRRLFFPEWYFTMVKPREEMPSNYVRFHIPADMTKYDVKEYLDKLYNVSVVSITLGIVNYQRFKAPNPWRKNSYTWKFVDPWKIAHVYLANGDTFKFPDVFQLSPEDAEEDDADSMNEETHTLLEIEERMKKLFKKQQSQTSDRDKIYFDNRWL
uniref:Large ribosomal subunit protein uL23m n=1 Tax=Phallusia mammillata TaxID=59560 RepID=A0A6F9DLV5_9ASCI|nr:39S ribosomal protein L23, mitochondrial-like [Phallusia mammillata]